MRWPRWTTAPPRPGRRAWRPGPGSAQHHSSVDMAQVAAGGETITHTLLELLAVGKAAIALALPQRFVVVEDFEIAAMGRYQGDFFQLLAEGGEQFLRQPGAAQQPLALGTVVNANT